MDRREKLARPRGLFARTFERRIYKKLKPLIQIRGIRVDEKELGRQQSKKTQSPPPPVQHSILTNGRERLTQQQPMMAAPRTKRPAPPPPIISTETSLSENLSTTCSELYDIPYK